MTDDVWKQYRQNNISPGVVISTPKNDDPWAEYRIKSDKSTKPRNEIKELPLSKKFNAGLDAIGLGGILPRLPEDTNINKNQTGISTSVIKGIPFVQHLLPDNPYQSEWEKQHPIQDFTGRAFGFAGSAGAGSSAVAAKVGQGFVPQLFSQMGYGGLLGGSNEAVRQQVKGEEFDPYKIALTGAVDAGINSTGPILGKLISPGAKQVNKFAPLEKAITDAGWSPVPVKTIQDVKALIADKSRPEIAEIAKQFEKRHYDKLFKVTEHLSDRVPEAIKNAALMSVLGGVGTGHPIGYAGGLLLGAATPFVKDAKNTIAKSAPVWWHNNVARTDPLARALLNNFAPTVKHGLEE